MQSGDFPPQGGQRPGGAPIPPPQGYSPQGGPPPQGYGGYPPQGGSPQGGPGYSGPGYGGPGYGGPVGPPVNTTMPLVFGILGVLCCGIFGPIAIVQANGAIASMNGEGNPSDRSTLNIARILGIVGSVFLVLQILYFLFMIVAVGMGAGSASRANRSGNFRSQPPAFSQPQ